MIFPRHTFYIYLLDKSYHTVKEKQHTTLLIKDIGGRRLLIQTKKEVRWFESKEPEKQSRP